MLTFDRQQTHEIRSSHDTMPTLQEFENARRIIDFAIKQKVAKLAGVESNEIKDAIALSDVGLDSFLADELQSWINATFTATVEISEVLDSTNISELVNLATTKSLEPRKYPIQPFKPTSSISEKPSSIVSVIRKETPHFKKLPNLPLPTLESSLNTYLSSVQAISTEEEFIVTERIVSDFIKPGSLGQKLHQRLADRRDNPDIDCWLIDLYNNSCFLDRNTPLAPFSSFFYTHHLTSFQHGQAERAAVITVAARKFKDLYEAGKVKPEQLNGQDTCMSSLQWLFGTHRKPCIGPDQMEKYTEEDYIAVLRRGRLFKVPIKEQKEEVSFEKLKATFEAILEKVDTKISWSGILTADARDSWAKIRSDIEAISEGNKEFLRILEAASFLICLDDASPGTSSERAYHFHFGDGSNRWWDKGMQFAICSNGISGQLIEHTMIDASTVYPLNIFMTNEIMRHMPDASSSSDIDPVPSKEYIFNSNENIEIHINRVRKEYRDSCAGFEHRFLDYDGMGASLPRQKRFPLKSTFQIAVALASRMHFDYNPAFWDGVSLASFYRGRVDINQVTVPAVVAFCNSAYDESITVSARRKLLYNATKTHANSVTRAVRGRGFDRYMTSLRQMLKEDEPVPELFTDPVYLKSRPRKIMSHCHDTGMLEKGFALRDPDSVWVHFEVQDASVRFSITGQIGQTERFENKLKEALETVKNLLNSE
ncbi:mycocerosic acid synthase [Phlyctema vagabunda]|uniref:Mycocerosic acid synthase n=1 Tax=Phlyctema vagabunda TaxID=108571 RepID=A0ABR4P2A0_9HELO